MRAKTSKKESAVIDIEREPDAERENEILATVAAAELEAAEAGPDSDSAALVTDAMCAQGIRPVSADQPKGVKCPECNKPLVIAPRNNKEYVVCVEALKGEDACWYHRELPASPASPATGKKR